VSPGPRRRPTPPFPGLACGPTLWWVRVPRAVPFRNGGRLWVGDTEMPRQPRLAIVADAVQGAVTLAYCGVRWNVVAMVGAASVEAAMRHAERFYQGLRPHWVDCRVSKREIARYMQTRRDEEGCSFCDKAPGELETDILLFEARGARICSDCIRALHEEMRHTWRTRSR
jgi:hypothetical protein